MKRVNLTKYGFIPAEPKYKVCEGDKYYHYSVGDLDVIKTSSNKLVELYARPKGWIFYFPIIKKLPNGRVCRLNKFYLEGVSSGFAEYIKSCNVKELTEADIVEFYNDCLEFEKEYKTFQEQQLTAFCNGQIEKPDEVFCTLRGLMSGVSTLKNIYQVKENHKKYYDVLEDYLKNGPTDERYFRDDLMSAFVTLKRACPELTEQEGKEILYTWICNYKKI